MNRLSNIATRQRSTRIRDAVFALCVAAATVVSFTAVTTACQAATTTSTR